MEEPLTGATLSRRTTTFPAIHLDRTSAVSLSAQIADQIARSIEHGTLGRAARLPSSRRLAQMLAVSRNTVLAAYDELNSRALVEGEHGSGTRISAGSVFPTGPLTGLRQIMSSAHFPECAVHFADADGNPLYINGRATSTR